MRKWTKSGLAVVVVMAAGALGQLGCEEKPPVTANVSLPTLRVHGQSEMTKEGITITVEPIVPETEGKYAQVRKTVSVTVARQNILSGQSEPVETNVSSTIVPEPSFYVRVANHTGHVIRFTQTVFRLQDTAGRNYPLYSGSSELSAWLEGAWSKANGPRVAQQVMGQLSSALASLPLMNRNTELLNGDEYSGYLVFNVPSGTKADFDQFLNSFDRLTLRMAEVPVDVNDAGAVTRTTEFTFHMDRTTSNVRVSCPADEQPSLENPRCSRL